MIPLVRPSTDPRSCGLKPLNCVSNRFLTVWSEQGSPFPCMWSSRDLCRDTAVSLSILPAAAKRFDEMNACAHLKGGRLGQRKLIRQQRPLGVNDSEIVHEAV